MAKSDQQLSRSQVTTRDDIVAFFWRLLRERRPKLHSVLDMGAGDARFANHGHFDAYTGVEIDRHRSKHAPKAMNRRIIRNCVFRHRESNYDACIGNPPYVRHHDIEHTWKSRTLQELSKQLAVPLDERFNLYLYFLCLGILKAKDNGLVAMLIPYEWVSRPSAKPLRKYIADQKWNVDVFRFTWPIFDGVLTTASITIIDKSGRNGRWTHFDVEPAFKICRRLTTSEKMPGILNYEARGDIWAMRGLSPGSQKIFTLTEGERVHFGLSRDDVVPCVTSLRNLPATITVLNAKSFREHFVNEGRRCWLIKSYFADRSPELNAYLNSVTKDERATATCQCREQWFRFKRPAIPKLLVASGFTSHGPKIVTNTVKAIAVGTVFGVYCKQVNCSESLNDFLSAFNFETAVVSHAKSLKKIEVRQLNAVLNTFVAKERLDASSTKGQDFVPNRGTASSRIRVTLGRKPSGRAG